MAKFILKKKEKETRSDKMSLKIIQSINARKRERKERGKGKGL